MAISDLKFQSSDFTGKDIASLADRPGDSGMTAAQLKARFDQIPKMMVALGNFNDLIDALKASGGASEIGAVNEDVGGDNVQEVLDALSGWIAGHLADLDNPHAVKKAHVGLGNADNTSDADKPVSTAQAAAIAAVRAYIDTVVLNAGAVSSVFGRAGEVTAQAGDYTAAQVGARPDSWMPSAADVGAVDGATGQGSAVRISNRNLLDNWYFASPVNQRGQTSYMAGGYTIDRWNKSADNLWLSLQSGFARLEKTAETGYPMITQLFDSDITDFLIGKEVTASVLTSEGLFFKTFTIPSGSFDLIGFDLGSTNFVCNLYRGASLPAFRIISKGSAVVGSFVNLIAAKMELGSVSTLAHQDADGNWVLNDPPPNYAEELAKCQRYFEVETLGAYTRLANMIAYDTTTAYGMIPTAGKRVTPIISYLSGAVTKLSLSQGTSYLALTNLEVITCGANFLYVKATVASGLTANANYFIRTVSEPVTLGFDANL